MAKVTFGGGVTNMRNKLGGSVFSRNGGGDFVRTWFVPPYRSTARTVQVRGDFQQLTKAWATALTEQQREQWRGQALTFYACVHGRPVGAVGGLQTFVAANMNLRSVGLPDIMEPTFDRLVSVPGDVAVDPSGLPNTSLVVNVANNPAPGDAVRVWVTPPLSAGRKYVWSFLRLIQTFPPGTPGPYDVTAAYAARGFDLAKAGALGVGVEYVAGTSGQLSLLRTQRVLTGGPEMLRTARVVLTDAQFKTLPTVPVQLIAAPGVGKAIIPVQFVLSSRFAAGGYGAVDATTFLRLDNTAQGYNLSNYVVNDPPAFATGVTDLVTATDQIFCVTAPAAGTKSVANTHNYPQPFGQPLNTYENLAVSLWSDNSVNFTGGNPANTLTVNVAYVVVDV